MSEICQTERMYFVRPGPGLLRDIRLMRLHLELAFQLVRPHGRDALTWQSADVEQYFIFRLEAQ